MSNWCEYWAEAKLVPLNAKDGVYRLVNWDDSLDFYVDKREGRTFGMIFLFAEPGKPGSTMAKGDEATFLEDILKRNA